MIESFIRTPIKKRNGSLFPEAHEVTTDSTKPHWGAAYLTQENVDRIISSIDRNNPDREKIKSELQKSLQVWGLNNSAFKE